MSAIPENGLMMPEIVKRARERRALILWLVAMVFGTHLLAIFAGAIVQHAFFEPPREVIATRMIAAPTPSPLQLSKRECVEQCIRRDHDAKVVKAPNNERTGP